MKNEQITEVVVNTLTNIVNDIPELSDIKIEKSSPLLAEGSFIDSLTLVSFIVELESVFSDEYNLDISLSDDKAMTRDESPFTSILSLVEYIDELLNNK